MIIKVLQIRIYLIEALPGSPVERARSGQTKPFTPGMPVGRGPGRREDSQRFWEKRPAGVERIACPLSPRKIRWLLPFVI
jgi:hypothetical protein